MVFASSSQTQTTAQNINIGNTLLYILEGIHKNGITSDINANMKISGTPNNIRIIGNADVENIGLNVYTKPLPKGFVKLVFKNNNTSMSSKIFTSTEDYTEFNGEFKTGKNPKIDVSVKSKADLGDIINVFDSVLKSFNFNQLDTLKAQGNLDADFSLKSNLKTLNSDGFAKLSDGNVSYGLYNVAINNIKSDLDFSGNSIKIKDTGFNIMGQPLQVYGEIKETSDCDVHLIADKLQLKGLLLAAGQAGLLKENDINSGTISADVSLKGKLEKLIPDVKISVDNINIKNNPSNTRVTMNSADVDIDTNGKTYSGKIDVQNISILNPMATIKAPKSLITFGEKDIVISDSAVYLNNSKIDITGKITDYISEKIKFDIKANGDIISSDIKSIIPKELGLDVDAKGSMPLIVTVSGDGKKQNILVNLKATPNGYVSILNIDTLSGHNTIINSNISIADNSLKLSDTGIFRDSLSNPVVKVTGGISDLAGKQILNSLNIATPLQVGLSIPGFTGSNVIAKADVTLNGQAMAPSFKGSINIPSAKIPTLKLDAKNINVNMTATDIVADAPSVTVGNSDFNGKAKISTNFNNGIIINSLDFNSKYLDSDELLAIMASIPAPTQNSASGQGGQADLGITIFNGKINIGEAKSGALVANNITSPLTLKNNVAYLNNLSLKAYNGTMNGKITYNVMNANTTVDVKGEGMNAIKAIEAAAGIKNAMSGNLGFGANLTLNAANEKIMMQSMKGKVDFSITDGAFLNIGTLQSFLNAQNILQNPLLKAAVNSITYLQPIKNTANFKSLTGDITLSNGWASLNSIKSQGQSLCYYITGKYNLLNANSSIIFLGRLDEDVVALLGPVGSLSVNKLTSFIPKFGTLTGQLITAMTSNPENEKTSLIPELLSGSKNYKDFKVEMIGILGTPSAVKSFKWLTVCDTSEINPLSVEEQIQATKDAVKDAYKNQVQEVKNSIENAKQEMKNKVEAARQEINTEAEQTTKIRKNLTNIKNLQDLLKNNGASMGTGE